MTAAGVAVHHARQSKFHMTLARVHRNYSVGSAVDEIRATVFSGAGLRLLLCRFELLGTVYEAEGGCVP
jgi:hypothetical protein